MLPRWIIALAASTLLTGVAGHAHSEEEIQAELQLREIVAAHSKRALAQCAHSPSARALRERAVARRAAAAHAMRRKRSLVNEHILSRRQSSELFSTKWATMSHESSQDFTLDTPVSDLFDSNTTCALVPEATIGPYWVAGELLRTDITDSQAGIPVHLDIQFIDTSTCEPPSSAADQQLLIDIWHCNATGVYSGVDAPGQGGVLTAHGRGVQTTDSDGVVQFDTVFPGHYAGRATHIHLMATSNPDVLPNETFTGGTARHIGQLYFDQDLRDDVEKLTPYSTNKQSVVSNLRDSLATAQGTRDYDPYLNWVMLGDKLEDGLLMWITIGLNMKADYTSKGRVAAAATYEGDGTPAKTTTPSDGQPPESSASGEGLASTGIFASSSTAAAGRIGVMNMGWP